MWRRAGMLYVARHHPDTLPISSRTSESRSDRRPNPRVILSNPKGAPWGSVQIGNLFLMSPLIPGPANGVAYPTSNGRIYSPTGSLRRSRRVVGTDTGKSFSMVRAIVQTYFVVLILEFQKSSIFRNQERRQSFPQCSIQGVVQVICNRFMENPIISRRISVVCVMEDFVIRLFRHLNQRSVKCC